MLGTETGQAAVVQHPLNGGRGDSRPQKAGLRVIMSKIICPPQSGRVGDVVYVQSARYGQIVRKYVPPRNPRSQLQQKHRSDFGALSTQWRALPPENRSAWSVAADRDRTGLNGYNYFMKVNASRVHLGLSRFDLPPSRVPSFSPNPVAEVAVVETGGVISIKLRVSSQPGQYTLVQGAAPVSTGVRCVQQFRFLGLLPAPTDGWSDITALYVARFGVPTPGTAVFIRTRQQIDGWMDLPKVTSAVVPRA